MIKCAICEKQVTSKRGLSFHIKKHDIDSINEYFDMFPSQINEIEPKDDDLLTCPICGKYNLKQLGQHITWIHKISLDEFKKLYPNQKMFIDEISNRCRKAQRIGISKYIENKRNNPEKYEKIFIERSKKRLENNPDIGSKISSILRENGTYEKLSERLKNDWKNEDYIKHKSELCKRQHENGLTEIVMSRLSTNKFPVYINGNLYMMKSSWEVKFAKLLFIYGINFEYEPFFIQYEYNNSTRKYFPDFYICDTNIIFEVKPVNLMSNDRNVAKRQASIEQGFDFRYISECEILGYSIPNLTGCFNNVKN